MSQNKLLPFKLLFVSYLVTTEKVIHTEKLVPGWDHCCDKRDPEVLGIWDCFVGEIWSCELKKSQSMQAEINWPF